MKYTFYLIFFATLLFTCKDDKTHIVHRELVDEKEDFSPELRFGNLFEQVQMEGVFEESSTFANAIPKAFTKKIMKAYKAESENKNFDLKKFVNQYFDTEIDLDLKVPEGTEVEAYLEMVLDKMKVTSVASKGSVMEMSKKYLASRSSNFPEIDYAESYFNLLGLEAQGDSEMLVEFPKNFAFMLHDNKCIPQKNRSYSTEQTGPPYLSAMTNILEASQGERILKFYLGSFFKEYQYWMNASYELVPGSQMDHSVKLIDGEILNRYWSGSTKPRIAFYKEDKDLVERIGDPKILRQVRAIQESTWLESSRWGMSNNNYEGANITNLIPVDLNALLYNLEKSIARAYKLLKQDPKSEFFFDKAEARKNALIKYCWNEEEGYFFDYNYVDQNQSEVVSIAGIYPLFFEIVDSKQAKRVAAKFENELLKEGGVSATNVETDLFWDASYGKAAYQWIAYKALKNYKQDTMAEKVRSNWIKSQEKLIQENKILPEFTKLDPTDQSVKESSFATSSVSILLKFLKE